MRAQLQISEVAQLLGITPKAIRHYEKVGLLREPQRSSGGYRLYSAGDLLRLLRIRRLQALGLSLRQVRRVLGQPDEPQSLREVLQALSADLAAQIQVLEARKAQVERLLAQEPLASLDQPAEVPEILQWAQAQLGERAQQISPDLWEQDQRMWGLLEAFQWPGDAQEQMKAAARHFLEQPEYLQRLLDFAEKLTALAALPEDAPEVERLAEEAEMNGLVRLFQAELPLAGKAPEGQIGAVMGELLLSTLAPAQRRFLELVQRRMAETEREQR